MKKPCLIIFLLTFAILNKSFGNSIFSKADTGKWVTIQQDNHISIYPPIKNSNLVKPGTDLLKEQLSISYSQSTDIRSRSGFADAELIRTGWDDGIFKTNPGFYRHDLVSRFPAGFLALSETDRRMFIITINQDSVRQMKDTVCYSDGKLHRCLYAVIPVILRNQSSDTLKYINMSCSWFDVFKTDAESLKFLPTSLMEECWRNTPAVYAVPPHQQKVFYIPAAFLTDTGKGELFVSKAFRIGMSLYKYIEGSQLPVEVRGLTLRRETDNVIWSNEIAVR